MSDNEIKVSIIIPVYNVEAYLRKCLDSVVGQTYGNLEIIIVDDGATDDSYAICREYADRDSRIVLIHQENGGLSAARNTGIEHISGDYVLFVDSDDWIDVDMVRSLVNLATERNADVVSCGVMRTSDDNARADNSRINIKEYSARDYVYLMTRPAGVFCYAWSRLIRRELVPDNAFPVGKVFEDVMSMPEIIYNANKVVVTSAKYCYYRYRRTGISHGTFTYKAMHEMDGYITVVDFAEALHDWKIARNGILFFLTKYHYYYFKVRIHGLDREWYRNTYKAKAHEYWKMLFCRSKRKGMI